MAIPTANNDDLDVLEIQDQEDEEAARALAPATDDGDDDQGGLDQDEVIVDVITKVIGDKVEEAPESEEDAPIKAKPQVSEELIHRPLDPSNGDLEDKGLL